MGSTRIADYPDLEAELNRELKKILTNGVLINGLTITGHAAAIARTQKIEGFLEEEDEEDERLPPLYPYITIESRKRFI